MGLNLEETAEMLHVNSGIMKKVLAFFMIFLTIHGTIGFAEFIYEESMQTAMFAAFSYTSAKDWDGLQNHLNTMRGTQEQAEFFIVYCGWLAPLMWPAYLNYLSNNAAYIRATEKRIRIEKAAMLS